MTNRTFFVSALLMLAALNNPLFANPVLAQCSKDTDCKGDRICEDGKCQSPASSAAKEVSAPQIQYESVPVTDYSAGDVFSVDVSRDPIWLTYIGRIGAFNVLENVLTYPDMPGYIKIERAYKFGKQYLLVISTGENGASCPATTYAFTFDTVDESVSGKQEIDGCSEDVEALAEGNKLTVKKDGKASVFYNGIVK